jgi:hypothetical protein
MVEDPSLAVSFVPQNSIPVKSNAESIGLKVTEMDLMTPVGDKSPNRADALVKPCRLEQEIFYRQLRLGFTLFSDSSSI